MAKAGQIVAGKFRILRLLEQGGMSNVYLAQDIHLQKDWAVKEIRKTIRGKENTLAVRAALREAQIIKGLEHPAIVRIVDIIEDEKALYIVEDYVRGISLGMLAERKKQITQARLLDWALQICEVLLYLHSRNPPVIYRDIKPDNLILTESGHIRLIDFGIARYYKSGQSRDTVYLGTQQFAAPEQYERNGRQTDERTDIFGFGATFSYLARLTDGISPSLKKVIQKCIEQDPRKRYQNAADLQKGLKRAASPWLSGTRRKLVAVAAGTALTLAVTGFLVLSPARKSGKQQMTDAVLSMIEAIKDDGIFDVSEEELLLQEVTTQWDQLQSEVRFSEMAYEIGMLYWYFYDYGNSRESGVQASIPWFSYGKEYDAGAGIYERIGKEKQEIKTLFMEQNTAGGFRACLEQAGVILALSERKEADGLAKLEACGFVFDLAASGVGRYKTEGGEKGDITALCNEASGMLQMLDPVSEREELLLREVQDKREGAMQAIEWAYGRETQDEKEEQDDR